jgi:zinc transporter
VNVHLLKDTDMPYGSDASGLIWGYVFELSEPGRAIDSSAVLHWLSGTRVREPTEFVWLHFSLSNSNSVKWLRQHLPVHEHYFETLDEGHGSTRVEQAGDCLIAVINDVIYDFAGEPSQTATLWMCIHRNFVVSARLRPLRSVDRLRVSVNAGAGFMSPIALLAHLLRDQADVLQQIGHDAASRVDRIEDDLLVGRLEVTRSELGSLRRVLVRLRRLLAPEPGAMFRLLSRPPEWFADDDARELRSAAEEFSAILNDLGALQERTKLLQEELAAHTTEQTSRSVFVLTMVTVLALPINIIAGLLGMNVGGIPLSQDPQGFWIIAGIIVCFTAIAGWLAFFKQRD